MGESRTHEEVICIWAESSHFEELHEIPKLTVDVTANLYSMTSIEKEGSMERRVQILQMGCHEGRRTVTGASTTCTFPSSIKISRALRHNRLTSSSVMGSQRVSCSICLYRRNGPAFV